MSDDDAIDWALTHALRAALVVRQRGRGLPQLAFDDGHRARVLALADESGLGLLALEGLSALGNPVDDLLPGRRRDAAVASLVFDERRRRLSALLERAGVAYAFFKGALMDPLCFDGSGARGSTDIDVLVDVADLDRVSTLLLDHGGERLAIEGRAASLGASHARVFHWRERGAPVDVDVHVALLDTPPFVDPARDVLARRVSYTTRFGAITGLSLDDALAYAGAKLVQGGFLDRLKLAVDASMLLARGADVELSLSRARGWSAAKGLAALLALVERRLGAPRPGLSLGAPFARLSTTTRAALSLVTGMDRAPVPPRGVLARTFFADDARRGAGALARAVVLRGANRVWDVPVVGLLARASSEYLSMQSVPSTEGGRADGAERGRTTNDGPVVRARRGEGTSE